VVPHGGFARQKGCQKSRLRLLRVFNDGVALRFDELRDHVVPLEVVRHHGHHLLRGFEEHDVDDSGVVRGGAPEFVREPAP